MPAGSRLEANKMLLPYTSPNQRKGIVDQKEGRELYPHFYAGEEQVAPRFSNFATMGTAIARHTCSSCGWRCKSSMYGTRGVRAEAMGLPARVDQCPRRNCTQGRVWPQVALPSLCCSRIPCRTPHAALGTHPGWGAGEHSQYHQLHSGGLPGHLCGVLDLQPFIKHRPNIQRCRFQPSTEATRLPHIGKPALLTDGFAAGALFCVRVPAHVLSLQSCRCRCLGF